MFYPHTYYTCTDGWIGPDDNILEAFEGKVTLDGDIYTLNKDFTITDDTYFPLKISDGKTFDGSNNTITYNGTNNWEGLFEAADDKVLLFKSNF